MTFLQGLWDAVWALPLPLSAGGHSCPGAVGALCRPRCGPLDLWRPREGGREAWSGAFSCFLPSGFYRVTTSSGEGNVCFQLSPQILQGPPGLVFPLASGSTSLKTVVYLFLLYLDSVSAPLEVGFCPFARLTAQSSLLGVGGPDFPVRVVSSSWNWKQWQSMDSGSKLPGVKSCFLAVLLQEVTLSPCSSW